MRDSLKLSSYFQCFHASKGITRVRKFNKFKQIRHDTMALGLIHGVARDRVCEVAKWTLPIAKKAPKIDL